MLRKLLTIVLPLALPFIIYFGYVILARRAGLNSGQTGSTWRDAPWGVIVFSGVALMAAVLIAVRIFGEQAPPGAKIVPDRYIDGEIQRHRVVE